MNYDLFGNEIIDDVLLRDKFIEPPFSVLDTKTGSWQTRKNQWKRIGIKSEVGSRIVQGNNALGALTNRTKEQSESTKKITATADGVTFDPALCEVIYHWFCKDGGRILDPFCGGSVRGIVASYLGYKYLGVDIRPEQIESNYEQAKEIFKDKSKIPDWICGDSNEVIEPMEETGFDLVFSCPPYADLEVYSNLEGDISNMSYSEFLIAYRSIIKKSCDKLKTGSYAVFVVGEIRDKNGNYVGFVPDTIKAFTDSGMAYYNEAILLKSIASASMRANNTMKNQKLVKIHQNVLVFKKS